MLFFVYFSMVLCLYTALHNQSMLSNFLVFYTSGSISSRPAAFLLLSFFGTESSSSNIIYPGFSSCWPIIISSVSLFVISGGFPNRFLKCSFNFWIVFLWADSFYFNSQGVFPSLTSFTVCHVHCDCFVF